MFLLQQTLLVFLTFSIVFTHFDNFCVKEETRSLEQLYQAALAEGGKLVLYGGGDAPDQLDSTKQAFEARFPNISIDIVVDYSKFHDARIDLQVANGTLIPDVAQLQTLHDFPRWKKAGLLMPYKPAGWNKVYTDYKDSDGFHTGIGVVLFSYIVNAQLVNESDWPRTANDFLKPAFKGGKLALTYPNDDDAVLFLYRQLINKYGWSWFAKLVAQKPILVRGTAIPVTMVYNSSAYASMGVFAGSVAQVTNGNINRFSLPINNDSVEPFTAWAQQAAIFKNAKHPAAAKLYLNWQLEYAKDTSITIWSVRTDVTPVNGYKPIWEYPNSSHKKFAAFMEDREAAELFRTQIMLYIGEPQGPPAAGILGPTPTQSCNGPSLTQCQ